MFFKFYEKALKINTSNFDEFYWDRTMGFSDFFLYVVVVKVISFMFLPIYFEIFSHEYYFLDRKNPFKIKKPLALIKLITIVLLQW